MSLKITGGTLVISIDLDEGGQQGPTRPAITVASQLNRVLDKCGVPATWLCSHPAKLAGVLQASRLAHEVGMLANQSWVGRDVGRSIFARELTDRVSHARAVGVRVSTLGLRDTKLEKHLDLLVKHRINVVRSPLDSKNAGFVRPHALRFGVWEAAPTVVLPNNHLWLPAAAFSTRWTISRAATSGEIVHLALDATKLDEASIKPLERLIGYASRLRDEKLLLIQTVGHLASRWQRRRANPPMKSVLRAA